MVPTESRNDFLIRAAARIELDRRAVLQSPHALARILNYDVCPHHARILDYLTRQNETTRLSQVGYPARNLVLAPRGAGKSTMTSITYPLWRLLKDPDLRILIVSGTQNQAISFMRELKTHIEQSPKLRFLFGDLIGKRWTDNEIDVKTRAHVTKESNLTAFGIFGAIIAKHYDLIIADDIVSQDMARSQTQRDKLKEWWAMSLMPCLEPHGEVIVIGTRYHVHDLYGDMINNEQYGKDYLIIKAIENGVSFWPEKFSLEHLESLRKEMGTPIFNAQYQNDPAGMTGGLFKPQWFRNRYRMLEDGTLLVEGITPADIKALEVTQGIDLAISQKTTADYVAISTIGTDRKTGHFYLLGVKRGRWTIEEQRQQIYSEYKKWHERTSGVQTVAIESTAFQDTVPTALLAVDPRMPIRRIKPSKDKVTRTRPIAAIAEDGRLHLSEAPTDDTESLFGELIDFPQGDHDDMIDSLEMAITAGSSPGAQRVPKPRGM